MPSMGGSDKDTAGDDVSGSMGGGMGGMGGSNGNESMGGFGGFGGLGIGNPGSYGGQQSVGAPGFSGGYGGGQRGSDASIDAALRDFFGEVDYKDLMTRKGTGMPTLGRNALGIAMSAAGLPFGGALASGIDALTEYSSRKNNTLNTMREMGYTDQELGNLLGNTAVSLSGGDDAAMWGSDEWDRQINNAMVGKYHSDQWNGPQSSDAAGQSDTSGPTGSLSDDWKAFEGKFGGMGDQIMSDYQGRMSSLPQLNIKLPGRMGGGNIPMAPGKWAGMYGDQARTEGGIMDRMADANATGIGGRQDIWRTNEQIKNQQTLQGNQINANEPNAWESWAPVVASGVDTVFNTDWGELADTIGGWF